MKTKSVNSLEVAKRAGVSQATVSYVLNKRGDQAIPEQTKQRVLDAARELKYRPNRLANGVLRGKTNIVGVVSPFLTSDFHASVLRGVCEVFSNHGYHSFVAWATMDPDAQLREVELMLEHRVDGIVWMSGTGPKLREFLLSENLNCVVIDDSGLSDIVDCVVSDDSSGAKAAVEHLLSLGHKRIAFWSKVWDSSSYKDREKGYGEALEAAGIGVAPELIRTFPDNERRVAIELNDFLKIPNPPTAFVTTNDIAAMIIKHAAEDIGLNVPDDIAITGYSNQDYADFNDLTTVSQNSHGMGRAGAELLLRRMANPGQPPRVEYTKTELIVRSSTAPQPRKVRFDPLDSCD